MPKAPAQFVDISLQRFLRVLLGLGPWQQTPDDLLEIPHPHRDVKPVKYRCGGKWELTIDALDPLCTVCDHPESCVRGPRVRLDKGSEPFGQIRQLASHAREDARLFPRRGETSGKNFEAPDFCLSPPRTNPPSIARVHSVVGLRGCAPGSSMASIRVPTRNVLFRTV